MTTETFDLETRHWSFNDLKLRGTLFQIIKGEYISDGPSFLYVLPDDRDDSNLHCSASEGPGSRRRARMNGAGAERARACMRAEGRMDLMLLTPAA